MEVIETSLLDVEKVHSNLIDKNICFFDIETTGLSRNKDIVYLVGVLYFNRDLDSWLIRQFFAPDLKDEVKVLEEAVRFMSTFDTIVNYNGNTFDLPFVNTRLGLLGIDLEIPLEKSLDIYAILRRERIYLGLENLKLTSVERYLGIFREDIYSGRDCIKFYKDFILTNDLVLKERILKHNFDDLYYLLEVIGILDVLDANKRVNINRPDMNLSLTIDSISHLNDYFTIQARIEESSIGRVSHYGENLSLILDNNILKFSFEYKKGLLSPSEECFFIFNKDYDIDVKIADPNKYNTPEGLTIIAIENRYLVDNIKAFLALAIERILL